MTKTTSATHLHEILQQQLFINLSTNPDSRHMFNFIRQNEINMANEPVKVEHPLLESSSEMDKLPCLASTEHSPDTKIIVIGTSIPAQEF